MLPSGGPSAGVVAILFTDLVHSTELLQSLGDEAAEELRRAHLSVLRSSISAASGREVKTLGDGVMVVFASAVQAVTCAVAIQRAAAEHNREPLGRAGTRVARSYLENEEVLSTGSVRFGSLSRSRVLSSTG
jgi:class 3 adenylate cyclase